MLPELAVTVRPAGVVADHGLRFPVIVVAPVRLIVLAVLPEILMAPTLNAYPPSLQVPEVSVNVRVAPIVKSAPNDNMPLRALMVTGRSHVRPGVDMSTELPRPS